MRKFLMSRGGHGNPKIFAELGDAFTWRVWADPETVAAKAAAASLQRVLNLWTEMERPTIGPADGDPETVIGRRAAKQFHFEPPPIKRDKRKPETEVVY